jgi:transcriptional regulator with XRE-family HTH domain
VFYSYFFRFVSSYNNEVLSLLTFYKSYVKLCAEKGVAPSAVAEKIGLSRTSPHGWKNGKMPSDVNLQKIADYFGVTVEYLKGEEEQATKKPLSEDEEWLNNLYNLTKDFNESDKVALKSFVAGLKANRKL